MGELKGENGLRSTVFVRTARTDPGAAPARGEIGENHAAVVGPEKPVPGRLRMDHPARIAGSLERGPSGFHRGLSLERLLIERQIGVGLAEAFRSDRAEVPVGGDLLGGN